MTVLAGHGLDYHNVASVARIPHLSGLNIGYSIVARSVFAGLKSAVSEITDRLWEDYQAFITRDLSDIDVEYLFADAIFESLRRQGAKEALLVAWCIDSDGRKHLLHLAVGNKESEAAWTAFFRNLIERGMRLPTTITTVSSGWRW